MRLRLRWDRNAIRGPRIEITAEVEFVLQENPVRADRRDPSCKAEDGANGGGIPELSSQRPYLKGISPGHKLERRFQSPGCASATSTTRKPALTCMLEKNSSFSTGQRTSELS